MKLLSWKISSSLFYYKLFIAQYLYMCLITYLLTYVPVVCISAPPQSCTWFFRPKWQHLRTPSIQIHLLLLFSRPICIDIRRDSMFCTDYIAVWLVHSRKRNKHLQLKRRALRFHAHVFLYTYMCNQRVSPMIILLFTIK